jgi:hypothetical protein
MFKGMKHKHEGQGMMNLDNGGSKSAYQLMKVMKAKRLNKT